VPLSPPQILHDTTWDWTWTATMGSQQLTTWAMVQPKARCHVEMVNTPALYLGCPMSKSWFGDRKVGLVSLTFLLPVFPQRSYCRTLNCVTVTSVLVPNIFSL
jgi:hypothetical protein